VRLIRVLSFSALLILTSCGNSSIATPERALKAVSFDAQVEICSFMREEIDYGDELVKMLYSKSREWRKQEEIIKIAYLPENEMYLEKSGEIWSACELLKKNDDKLRLQVENAISKKKSQSLEKDRLLSEALQRELEKIRPALIYWNEKASNSGSGDLGEYLGAISSAETNIKAGAQFSLSGTSREVQSSTCWATDRSRWTGGSPSGWWLCGINFVGSDFEIFSIEFSNGSWSGKPDGGSQAGRELNWKIPDSVLDWVNRNGSGT
jgi:hypothetical protein